MEFIFTRVKAGIVCINISMAEHKTVVTPVRGAKL